MTILLTVAVLSVLGYIGWQVTARFMETPGTITERLWAAASGSATVAVSYISGAALGALALLDEVPEFKTQIQAVIPADKWPYVSLGLMVLVYLARRRTL